MSGRQEILNLEEAALFLRVKPRTLGTLALRGEIPGVKIGGQWRFRRPALEALFDLGPARPAPPGGGSKDRNS